MTILTEYSLSLPKVHDASRVLSLVARGHKCIVFAPVAEHSQLAGEFTRAGLTVFQGSSTVADRDRSIRDFSAVSQGIFLTTMGVAGYVFEDVTHMFFFGFHLTRKSPSLLQAVARTRSPVHLLFLNCAAEAAPSVEAKSAPKPGAAAQAALMRGLEGRRSPSAASRFHIGRAEQRTGQATVFRPIS